MFGVPVALTRFSTISLYSLVSLVELQYLYTHGFEALLVLYQVTKLPWLLFDLASNALLGHIFWRILLMSIVDFFLIPRHFA